MILNINFKFINHSCPLGLRNLPIILKRTCARSQFEAYLDVEIDFIDAVEIIEGQATLSVKYFHRDGHAYFTKEFYLDILWAGIRIVSV